ncbi:MAG: DUF2442 domain-containing protein [Prevotellaceae bacterium]|jgi:hypothetical protein|nr:DUF2442 domain-containing protein [Prevotellaceae bacterium]
MNVKVKKIWTDENAVYIKTDEGKVYAEFFNHYPRLRQANQTQRRRFDYDNLGIHWEELDEDLSYEGFLHTNKCIAL